MTVTLYQGDCLEILPTLEANSVDAIVCDPPYGLSFMGKNWDHGVPGVAFWKEALRVAKPGAHLLAFGSTRTHHRLMSAIEDAGWEIRDCLAWIYGSGFPKSLDVSKAIDKAAGAEREVIGVNEDYLRRKPNGMKTSGATAYRYSQTQQETNANITAPATDAARQWDGWGTALKPAWEPIIMARKPLIGTVAQNVLVHGVAGLNVDACRIGTDGRPHKERRNDKALDGNVYGGGINGSRSLGTTTQGRWPSNLILDEESAALLDEMSGTLTSNSGKPFKSHGKQGYGGGLQTKTDWEGYYGDTGGASRFFYCAKASKRDRDEGLEGMEKRIGGGMSGTRDQTLLTGSGNIRDPLRRNFHPTVKPTQLMRYLCKLVTPPNGVILDPFAGSGSTLKAAILEGFNCVGIELDAEYMGIAQRRIAHAESQFREQVQAQIQMPLLAAAD